MCRTLRLDPGGRTRGYSKTSFTKATRTQRVDAKTGPMTLIEDDLQLLPEFTIGANLSFQLFGKCR